MLFILYKKKEGFINNHFNFYNNSRLKNKTKNEILSTKRLIKLYDM